MEQRVALYCRVSTADQSCARQERDPPTFTERCDYEVMGVPGVTILDPGCVGKTYPDYWRDLAGLGMELKGDIPADRYSR